MNTEILLEKSNVSSLIFKAPDSGSRNEPPSDQFHDGIAAVHMACVSNLSYMYRAGKVVFAFDSGADFVNGYASVGKTCVCGGSWTNRGVSDRTGNVVVLITHFSVGSYSGGFFAIKTAGRAGHINLQGSILGEHL